MPDIEKEWMEYIPGNDFSGAVSFLSDLGWNLTIREREENWFLYGGDRLIMTSATEEGLKSFVFGMALGLAVLPESIMEQIRKIIGQDED